MKCPNCNEDVLATEPRRMTPLIVVEGDETRCRQVWWHQNCFLRGIVGSLGHQLETCSCFGGDTEDPPDMTPREAADAAVALWRQRNQNSPIN